LRVEFECQAIRTRIKSEHPAKYDQLRHSEHNYRRDLYKAAYVSLLPESAEPTVDLADKIEQAEANISDAINLDKDPVLRKTMQVIANILTIVLSLGSLNAVHKHNTGDWLFYSRPASSEAIKILNREVIDLASPAA